MSPFDQDIAARTAIGEARGEGDVGMQGVIWTGVNRFTAKKWFSGVTLAGTFLMRDQYSCWRQDDPNYALICNQHDGLGLYNSAMQWADAVVKGMIPDPTLGATHYVNLDIASPAWLNQAVQTVVLGKHTFFKNVN